MTGGTYVLLCRLNGESPVTLRFGAAGERILDPARYAYVGSALGPGGFARIERHREIATGARDTRHWHVDYLLGYKDVQIEETYRLREEACECDLSDALEGEPVAGIGASDCACRTHFWRVPAAESVERTITSCSS